MIVILGFLLLCLQNVEASHDNDVSEDTVSTPLDSAEAKLHYALHAVHPHFKDGVFTSNQQAMQALEREDSSLASRVYALAKRQSNNTVTTSPAPPPPAPPPTIIQPSTSVEVAPPQTETSTPPDVVITSTPPPVVHTVAPYYTTLPYVTTSASSYETVVTSPNGVRSTFTTFTEVVVTATPTGPVLFNPEQATAGQGGSLQSFGVRAVGSPTAMVILVVNMILGCVWLNF
jgi:hypothetical protein